MGILYKGFQKVAYKGLEKAREKGIEVDKERQRLNQEKHKQEFYDTVGINWGRANKNWNEKVGRHFE